MKKLYLILLILILVLITGCGGSKIKDIKVDDITACVDNFVISNYSFVAVYEDKEETKQMTINMFSAADQNKFYEIGNHQVTLTYEGFKKVINIILEERKAIELIATPSSISSYLKEFEYEMVQLEVKYNDGTNDVFPLSRSYLDNKDIVSLGKAGTYDIELTIEGVSTIVHFELLPDETKIEDLRQDVIIYCITKKVGDKYQSTFFVKANKDFSGLQFKINKSSNTANVSIVKEDDNVTTILGEDYVATLFVSPKNITGTIELFTIEYEAKNQYRNFNMDYDFETAVVYLKNQEIVNVENYLFTFTR